MFVSVIFNGPRLTLIVRSFRQWHPVRRLCVERGLDWDRLSEDQREEFVNRLLHEE